ncbi:MAG: hypothetical protein VW270_05455 [Candidatus Poseidoniales archaeon]|jgi:uncharacterized coiled-coil protein SlyX
MTNDDAVQNVRLDALEVRLDKHDEVLEKMANAQTEMLVSIAKLHTSVRILMILLSIGVGVDLTGVL